MKFSNEKNICLLIDRDGVILEAPTDFKSQLFKKANLLNKKIQTVLCKEAATPFKKALAGLNNQFNSFEFSLNGDQSTCFEILLMPINPEQINVVVRDVSDRAQNISQLQESALLDQLTELPNRKYYLEHVSKAIHRKQRQDSHDFAVFFVDLDHFKAVNDCHGHDVGDALLQVVSEKLKKHVRNTDVVSRLGGDEFAILLEPLPSIHVATRIASRITNDLAKTVTINGKEVFSNASIGIASSEKGVVSADEIIRNADLAMYRAKKLGRGRYAIYDQDMHKNAIKRHQTESELRKALKANEFRLLYQPIINLRTNKVEKFECLVRWNHPKYGLISPASFIDVAEDSDVILSLGEWVLKTACKQCKTWHKNGFENVTVNVNLSPREFFYRENNMIADILTASGLDPSGLCLELTKDTLMRDAKEISAKLKEISASGVSISMEDFGLGQFSLTSLEQFPIQYLKIDRFFIQNIGKTEGTELIVYAIVDMAHDLGLKVVAEGVESEEQLKFLENKTDCDFAQGFYFSEAITVKDATALLKKNSSHLLKKSA